MTDSLRDQLLGLGFKPAPKPERKPQPRPTPSGRVAEGRTPPRPSGRPHPAARPQQGNPRGAQAQGKAPNAANRHAHGNPRSREDIDLAKAYAIRAQREKDERIEAERLKQEQARQRREAKARLTEFIKDKALNDPAAEIARHFDYGGKIKRIHVTETQLRALNAGELGVVQIDGRYLLVAAAVLAEAEAIFLPAIALKVDPHAPAADDPYADPRYQVPDDLVW
jgi:uncharacterized protein YaiL (DUF2058 family)